MAAALLGRLYGLRAEESLRWVQALHDIREQPVLSESRMPTRMPTHMFMHMTFCTCPCTCLYTCLYTGVLGQPAKARRAALLGNVR